jgi:predicted phosphodiesterase
MLLGLVTDIHEDVATLEWALAEFRRRHVEQVVSIGDACDTYTSQGRADEVVTLLQDAGALGVWGNHDVGLCFEVPELLRQRVTLNTLQYMATMQPHLVLDDCRFSHVEPWLDARKVEDLWYFDGPPDTPEKAQRSFEAVPERVLFLGHLHRWLVMTPHKRVAWDGEGPLQLNPTQRYLIVVGPIISGWCATYDTTTAQLIPLRCPSFL